MKSTTIILSVATLLLFSCSKEFDPDKYHDGQLVNVYVNHYGDEVFADAAMEQSLGTYVEGFSEREIGFTYEIRARVKEAPKNLMDSPNYWFVYTKTLSKKRAGNETFTQYLSYPGVNGFELAISEKEGGVFIFRGLELKPETDEVADKLREVIAVGTSDREGKYDIASKAITSHDPDNWGKAFIVHDVSIEVIRYGTGE